MRNNLSSLETLIGLTADGAEDVGQFAASIKGRVQALGRVHEMLTTSRWSPLSMRRLVEELSPSGRAGRVVCAGTELLVPPAQCTALGMVVHELMTNSLEHGALGAAEGRVRVAWSESTDDDRRRCRLEWAEENGPPIPAAPRPRLGTRLIEGLVSSDLQGTVTLAYPPSGARHEIEVLLDPISIAPGPEGAVCEVKWPAAGAAISGGVGI